MGYEAITTLVVLVVVLVALVRELVTPPATMLGAVVILVLLDVVDPAEGFAGFSSSATLTVAGLFVVARGLQRHAGLDLVLGRLLGGRDRGDRSVLGRLVAPVAAISSVTNNTPLVAALAPMVRGWAERHGRPASRFLMPLSFAAILGGVVTTIGTSTNLVVSGIVARSLGDGFSFLEVTPIGVPVAVAGAVLVVLIAPRVLPDRRSPHEQVATHERDYTFRLTVEPGGRVDRSTVAHAGLRNLENVFLASLERHGREFGPVAPDTELQGGDVLTFVGRVEQLRDLEGVDGLAQAESQTALLEGDRHGLFETVLSAASPLVGRTLKEVSFRGRYGGAVVAVHRAGQRVEGKLGETDLQAGDAMLVQADDQFADRWRGRQDFAVVVPLDDEVVDAGTGRRVLVVATFVAMVAVAATGILPILHAVLAACVVLVASRTITFFEAREALDIDVLLIIAASIGLGSAVESSGLAGEVADAIASVAGGSGDLAALAAVVIGTLVLTELVTNVASAALMTPIAIGAATAVGADPRAWAVAVAISASASFLTPIGYQTNTIVYGLGGYRFGDYWRLGLPLTVVVAIAVITTVGLG